jgi:hypothetical protein
MQVNTRKQAMFTDTDSGRLRRRNWWCRGIEASIPVRHSYGPTERIARSIELNALTANSSPLQRDVNQLSQREGRWQSDHIANRRFSVLMTGTSCHQRSWSIIQEVGQRQLNAKDPEVDV